MAKPVKFAHVVYMTRRYDEMIAWYRDVFEAEVVYENPALAFLTYDDEHHRFAFANLDILKPDSISRNDRGEINPMEVAEGDEIIFSKYGGTEVKVGADEVLILRQTDVLAKVVATGGKAKGKKELAGAAA